MLHVQFRESVARELTDRRFIPLVFVLGDIFVGLLAFMVYPGSVVTLDGAQEQAPVSRP